ncbi:MAG: CFI-box-CTERM domain-containing protein [Candidatus Paceibacterota bacterium]
MQLIEENPFRILGLSLDASEKEIAKRVSDLEIYAEMGKTKTFETDLSFLSPVKRTPERIKEASQKIEQPSNKFYQSLWWFWSNNSVDDLAFEVLKKGDYAKALKLWTKSVEDSKPTHKNISNFKNLGLLKIWTSFNLSEEHKLLLKEGLNYTGKYLTDDAFEFYKKSIISEAQLHDLTKSTHLFVDDLYKQISNHFENGSSINEREFLTFVKGFPKHSQKNIKASLISDPIHSIQSQIAKCRADQKRTPKDAAEIGIGFYNTARKDLKKLRDILSSNDIEYQIIADKIANELLECSITYFNYHVENSTGIDPGDKCLELIEQAKNIAVGQKAKNRINENLPTIKDWQNSKEEREKFNEIRSENDFILEKLKWINNKRSFTINDAETFVESCKPKLNTIGKKIGYDSLLYKDASNAVVNNALGIVIMVVNSNEPDIPGVGVDRYIQAIKKAYKVFQSMADIKISGEIKSRFVENHRIIRDLYLQIDSPNYSRSNNNSGGACYIATMVYGDYDHPKVRVLRKFRDEQLAKTVPGRLFINTYYKYSPEFVNITKDMKFLHKMIRILLEKTLICWFKS